MRSGLRKDVISSGGLVCPLVSQRLFLFFPPCCPRYQPGILLRTPALSRMIRRGCLVFGLHEAPAATAETRQTFIIPPCPFSLGEGGKGFCHVSSSLGRLVRAYHFRSFSYVPFFFPSGGWLVVERSIGQTPAFSSPPLV